MSELAVLMPDVVGRLRPAIQAKLKRLERKLRMSSPS